MLEEKKRILIVEDEPSIGDLLRELLEDANYSVDCVTNGQEALHFLQTQSTLPHLILLDFIMPIMDGVQTQTCLQQDVRLKNIPVIVMSADNQCQKKLKDLNVTAFLEKPAKIEQILAIVARHCLQ
jgi:CheY-like chemotaxis protein